VKLSREKKTAAYSEGSNAAVSDAFLQKELPVNNQQAAKM
jgi:hypothetical protein